MRQEKGGEHMQKNIFDPKTADGRLVYLIKALIRRFSDHKVSRMGGQLAYFFLLSLFPFLIFFNALIASFDISSERVMSFLQPFFPEQIVRLISSYIETITTNQSVSLLSIGIIIVIFSASKSVRSLRYAFNTAYDVQEKERMFVNILLSMAFVIGAGVVLLLVVLFVTLSRDFLTEIVQVSNLSKWMVNMLSTWRWVTLCVILFLILALMYKTVPHKKVRFLAIIPGTLFALAGFLALTVGFSLYVNYFLRSSAFYGGTIGAMLLLMLWIYFASVILVMGAELNSALESMPRRAKAGKAARPDARSDT